MSDSLIPLAPTAAPAAAHAVAPPSLASSVELCTFCPRLCSHTCPVSLVAARETLTPQAKMASLGLLQKSPEGEADATLATSLYGCTGCGACTTACLHHVEPGSLLMRGRAVAVHSGVDAPALVDLPERQRQRARESAQQVRADAALQGRFAAPGQVALLPTCLPPWHSRPATPAAPP